MRKKDPSIVGRLSRRRRGIGRADVEAAQRSSLASMSMHAALWRALPADPAGVARACLTYRELEGIVQGVLTSLAQKVLASEPVDQAAVHGVLEFLVRLCAHGDPSLVEGACGKAHLVDACILASTSDVDVRPLFMMLWPQREIDAWMEIATWALEHARQASTWTERVQRIRRAARMAYALLDVLTSSSKDELYPLAELVATLYHVELHARHIPPDEASSSATPWPTYWLATKVELLSVADRCVSLAPAVLDALTLHAHHIPDAVALVDAPLLVDLRMAAPSCAPHLPGGAAMPFPGAAWAAVRASLTTRVDPALVDLVLSVLPQLERRIVERRLSRSRYATMAPEEIVSAFLDDPDGLHDIEADHDPMPPSSAKKPPTDDTLPADVKAAILASAESQATTDRILSDLGSSPSERLLLQAYQMDASVFVRSKAARAMPARSQLREALAPYGLGSDEQIEEWAMLFQRDPHKQAKLTQAQTMVAPNLNVRTERTWGPDRGRGGRIPRGRGRGRGRGS